jgi:hypothetical protein
VLGQPLVEGRVGLLGREGSDDKHLPVTSIREEYTSHLVAGVVLRIEVSLARSQAAFAVVDAPSAGLDLQDQTLIAAASVQAERPRIEPFSVKQVAKGVPEHAPTLRRTSPSLDR